MGPHLAECFAFPVSIPHLTQVRNFLNGLLETYSQKLCRLARPDQRTGENMGDPQGREDLGGQACLFLPSCIEGGRTLARDPAADILIRLPVAYQYHQRHVPSFLCSK